MVLFCLNMVQTLKTLEAKLEGILGPCELDAEESRGYKAYGIILDVMYPTFLLSLCLVCRGTLL